MNDEEIQRSLARLSAAIPPPAQPVGMEMERLAAGLPDLPKELLRFTRMYGSGGFENENGGLLLSVLNPYESRYLRRLDNELETFRSLKSTEGDRYVPYDMYPVHPGLLIWGYGEGRKHFFWLTDGAPSEWKVVVFHDLEIVTTFDLGMLEFTERLLCGDLDCSFIGGFESESNHVDPSKIHFLSRVLPE